MAVYQERLQLQPSVVPRKRGDARRRLSALLREDLDFHGQGSAYASHNFHAFPAKFPPQLPRKFIEGLTEPGDVVLDPMVGSGTALVEAYLTGRRGIGFDLDPLAVLISKVKTTPLDPIRAATTGTKVLKAAVTAVRERRSELEESLVTRWSADTRAFVNYWFSQETQVELLALVAEIEKLPDSSLKAFLQLVFSSTIITKSGGVSLAFDLAHTRPHRAKVVVSRDGTVILGQALAEEPTPRSRLLTKQLRSPIEEYEKCLQRNLKGLLAWQQEGMAPLVEPADTQRLPLRDESVDLIVTSPPYASNAIDYMRAHKFSLVWLGYPIGELGRRRKEYIGGESLRDVELEEMPQVPATVIAELAKVDERKAGVLHRYFSEMRRTLQEMHRVLKPGAVAVVVVGNSVMRGVDTRTDACLACLGGTVGFDVPGIGVRNLDRNRRMMPAGMKLDLNSQIQQRMHQEFVIGLYKPTERGAPSAGAVHDTG